MAEEVATPVVEESVEDFFKAGNAADAARLRGDLGFVETPPVEVTPEVEIEEPPVEAPSDKKPDGRTLEGRRQKQYTEVEKATAARREAERELAATTAELTRRREELHALNAEKPQPPQTPPRQPVAQDDPEPTIEHFAKEDDPYTSWVFAKNAWTTRQEIRRYAEATAQHSAALAEHQSWEAKVEAAEQAMPGLREKLTSATIPIHRDTLPYIKRHAMGAQIASYLVDHPDLAQRLTTLHPVEQIGQIGEIVGELKAQAHAASSGSAVPARPVSQAKAPIQPLGTSPVATSPDPDDDEPIEQFVRRHNAADRKAGRL